MQLFRRKVSLAFENLDQGTVTTIEDLQVEFEITRTLEKEPSTLRATVYNLSETTRALIERDERIIVSLSAGYGDELHSLFRGDLRITRTRRDGSDIATDIEAGDGERGAKNWARKWFPKGASIRSMFSYLISKAEIGEGNLDEGVAITETNGIPDSIRAGRHVRGYALDELAELATSRGIDFSVQNNEAQFLPIAAAKQGIPVTAVEPSTGLIGSATIDNDGIMACQTLLLPFVFPGSLLEIKSEFVSGRFKVTRAVYTGSVYGEDFSIDIEGKQIR